MNKIPVTAFFAATLFSFNPASALDGVPCSNSGDQHFTTPEKFMASTDRISASLARQNAPARTRYSGH